MKPLNREEVVAALGQLDDAAIAQIIGMQATAEELAEARAWVTNDEALMNSGKPLATGRVGRLVEVLATLEEESLPDGDE